MSNRVELNVKLKLETVERINEIVAYSKFRKKYTKQDLPMSPEDVIKAALDEYIKKVDLIYRNVINASLYNLKVDAPIKNNIKKLMIEADLNQKEFSELCSIYAGTISHILSNRNQPSMDYFLRIWAVLGCPPIEHCFYREIE